MMELVIIDPVEAELTCVTEEQSMKMKESNQGLNQVGSTRSRFVSVKWV